MRDKNDRSLIDAVKARVRIEDVAGRRVALRRVGREMVGLSPFKPERTPSFYVDPSKQLFKCFASGEGGDVIRLVELLDGVTTGEAIRRLAQDAGVDRIDEDAQARIAESHRAAAAAREAEDARRKAGRVDAARRMVDGVGPAGDLVARYLATRGVDLAALRRAHPTWDMGLPPELLFSASMALMHGGANHGRWPAMVTAIRRKPGGEPIGIHRTYLARDGSGKARLPADVPAKLMLGQAACGAAWLHVGATGDGLIGEGIETTLAAGAALARAGRAVAMVAALSLDNLAGPYRGIGAPHPERPDRRMPSILPDLTRPALGLPAIEGTWVILADADGKDRAATGAKLQRAAARWSQQGHRVRIAWPELGQDFADMAAAGRASLVRRRLAEAC